jgi:hypothetical protein
MLQAVAAAEDDDDDDTKQHWLAMESRERAQVQESERTREGE